MSYSLEINGQTWYFSNKSIMQECEWSNEKLEKYKKEGLASTSESDLQVVQIGGFADEESSIMSNYGGLNEDSGYEIFNSTYNDLLNLCKKIEKIDWNNIDSITDTFEVLDQASALANKLTNVMTGATSKHSWLENTGTVLGGAAAGCGAGALVGLAGGPFAPITMTAGLIGGAIIGAIGGGIKAIKNEVDDGKLKELYKKIQDTTKTLANKQKECEEGLKEKAKESVENIKQKFGDFFGDKKDFSKIKSPSEIKDKLKALEKYGTELRNIGVIGETYGIDLSEIEEFKDIMEKLQDTENKFDQNFVEEYLDSIEIPTTSNSIDDTKNLQKLYEEIQTLAADLGKDGYDTTKFSDVMAKIQEENNKSIEQEAKSIEEGYDAGGYSGNLTGGIEAALNTANKAQEKYDGLLENSSSYGIQLEPLANAKSALQEQAQNSVNEYLQNIVVEDLSFEELAKVYSEVEANEKALEKYADQINLSGFITKLQEITNRSQCIQTSYSQEISSSCSRIKQQTQNTHDNSIRYQALQELAELKTKGESYGIDVSYITDIENQINEDIQETNILMLTDNDDPDTTL